MKKVSIIVPVYNMENYLKKCMDSLVNQTLKDIEIIVVNDGSTDNSLNILKEYEKEYPKLIKIIDQENGGISVARNNGIEIATGKYIGFVDSDDFVKIDMFEKLYKKIEETKSDIVVCDYEEYYMNSENYKYIEVIKNIKCDNLYNDPSIINNIDYAPWNKLYKRELFKNIRFPKKVKYEDLSTILKTFLLANKISTIKESLYLYRINDNGETKTVNKKVKDILIILNDIVEYSKSINAFDKIKLELKDMTVDKLFYYIISSYQLNDKDFVNEFRNEAIDFLNKNFNNWKITLLKNKKLNLKLISKIILMNNFLFKLYLNKKYS